MSGKAQGARPTASPILSALNFTLMIFLTWYICQPNRNPEVQLTACGEKLHEIGVALEKSRLMSEDGLYPLDLEEAFGKGELPACPAGGKESYIEGYTLDSDRTGYLLVCKGSHHSEAGVPADYPRIGFSVEEASSGNKSGKSTEIKNQETLENTDPEASENDDQEVVENEEQEEPVEVDESQAQVEPTEASSPTPTPNPE